MNETADFAARISKELHLNRARCQARKAVPVVTTCEHCGATPRRLERHHPDIVNRPTDVVVLCVPCHKKLHIRKGRSKPVELPLPDLEDRTYWTSPEAAAYLRFTSYQSFRSFRSRHGLPKGIRMGRKLLFTKEMLDEAMASLAERRPGPSRIRVR